MNTIKTAIAIAVVLSTLGLAYYAGVSHPAASRAASAFGVDTARIILQTRQ